jgi:plasmid stabilization system protein ParE
MKPLVIKPEAADDIREAFDYYEDKRPGLGTEFVDALDYTLDMISRFPLAYAQIRQDARRALLIRFPYVVIYTVEDDGIFVHACVHGKRHPRHWERRL